MNHQSDKEATFTVLNPSGTEHEVASVPMAARIPDLGGKVVYCISQIVGGADVFLKKIADALPRYAAGVKTVFVHKSTPYMSDDPELWDEILSKGHAVIYGCGA
ncbi:MAG: UGSC family (seleno)protein [Burkholderiales bacterium]